MSYSQKRSRDNWYRRGEGNRACCRISIHRRRTYWWAACQGWGCKADCIWWWNYAGSSRGDVKRVRLRYRCPRITYLKLNYEDTYFEAQRSLSGCSGCVYPRKCNDCIWWIWGWCASDRRRVGTTGVCKKNARWYSRRVNIKIFWEEDDCLRWCWYWSWGKSQAESIGDWRSKGAVGSERWTHSLVETE